MRFRVTFMSILLVGSAQAMEPGTYRPGQPYHSSKAGSAYACSAQCQSDNRCQSWNFVSINRDAKYGVCEYNARRVAPVSSPVSVSGESIASSRTSTQIVSAGTRTLRVGSMPSRTSYPSSPNEMSLNRRIVSQPVATQATSQHAAHATRLMPRPSHALDTLPQSRQVQTRTPQVRPASTFKHSLEAMTPQRARSQRPQLQNSQTQRHQLTQSQPQASAYMPEAQQSASRLKQAPRQMPMPKASLQPVQPSPTPVEAKIPVKTSLYGSLHDDVKVPKPLTAVPQDDDAPIATVSAVPTEKIMQDKLYGMAGPRR